MYIYDRNVYVCMFACGRGIYMIEIYVCIYM